MNYLNYRRQLEKQMYLYIEFLPFIKEDENYSKKERETMTFKLLDEIQFLKLRIQKIDRMNVCQASGLVVFKRERKTSNFKKVML